MNNLRILSMNLGGRFVPVKDREKREYLMDFIKEEDYDIVMFQGNNINNSININGLAHYKPVNYNNRNLILHDLSLHCFRGDFESKVINSAIVDWNKYLACISVNCKSFFDIDNVLDVCYDYSNPSSSYYVESRVVTGRFPKGFDTNDFCDKHDLEDVSSLVGQDTHVKNNKEMLNHLFISKDLEVSNIHKLIGMTEVSKIGEAYPIELTIKPKTLKKVLK